MITIEKHWWHPHEGHVSLPSETYLPCTGRYVMVTRNRHVVTQAEGLRGVPLVVAAGVYAPTKTKCPQLTKRFVDDGLVPLWRPCAYRVFSRKRSRPVAAATMINGQASVFVMPSVERMPVSVETRLSGWASVGMAMAKDMNAVRADDVSDSVVCNRALENPYAFADKDAMWQEGAS